MRKKRIIQKAAVLCLLVLLIAAWAVPAYAAGFSPEDLDNIGTDRIPDVPSMTATKQTFNTATKILIGICIPLGAVSLALFGMSFFMGDKKAEDAKNRAKYCLVALAALLLLTAAINMGRRLASGITWDPTIPENQNQAIIAPKEAQWDLSEKDAEQSAEETSSAETGG